jgi:hypothetical protein
MLNDSPPRIGDAYRKFQYHYTCIGCYKEIPWDTGVMMTPGENNGMYFHSPECLTLYLLKYA